MHKTASGLEYNDDQVGSGASPRTGQTCVMHYTGWLWKDGQKGAIRHEGPMADIAADAALREAYLGV